jgi:hypothetical protein
MNSEEANKLRMSFSLNHEVSSNQSLSEVYFSFFLEYGDRYSLIAGPFSKLSLK